jgi:NitT/TauT family transport system ATP-binding protein
MLQVKDLTRVYGRGDTAHVAIESVEFQVAEGELVSIVGPSGCGKSTVLRCVAGLLAPTSGQVVLRGEPVEHVPDRLAVVFQEYGRSLYPWLTVRDNVALPLRRRQRNRTQLKRVQRRQVAEESLAAVGLTGVSARYPWQLSGGMQQRVALARALACDPVLLLMDEPFGSVDAQTREDLEDLVLRVRQERNITILLVTHDIDESVYVGDRVIVLTPGPGRVRAELTVNLPAPRDQITTKELPEFVRLRTTVSRLVRGRPDASDPSLGARDRPATENQDHLSRTTPARHELDGASAGAPAGPHSNRTSYRSCISSGRPGPLGRRR